MFGSGVQSTWGSNSNQQQQQPQQPASAFGQPSAFGQSAFGGGGAFGQTNPQQQQQQQQQPANPMFGSSTTPAATGGFGASQPTAYTSPSNGSTGAFSNTNNPASTSVFGTPKPTSGFGAFSGGTGAFGGGATGGGAFGQTNPTPSAFGTTGTGTSAFGSPSNVFGQPKPAPSAFGGTPSATDISPAPVTTGTSVTPYAAHSEKESATSGMSHYQSITAMPVYRGTSFEELRVQDYAQGRKTAGAGGGAFGQPAFGQTSSFGSQPAQTSAFGSTNTGTSAFGAFGQPQTTGTTSAFGSAPTTSAFGQPAQPAQQQSAFGAFGQPQTQPQQQQTSAFGSAFGAKPATGFGTFGGGSTTTPSSTFGSTNTGGGIFGQNAGQPQQQTTSAFGQPASTTLGSGFGTFGSTNANKPFGQPAPATSAFGSGSSIFGQNTATPQTSSQPTSGSSIFGGFGSQQQQQQPSSLFGGTNPPTTGTGTGSSLFGGSNIFGGASTTNQQQQQQPSTGATGSLFGTKPAGQTTSLFGGFGQTQQQPAATASQSGGSLFGSSMNQNAPSNQQPAFGGSSLFGNKPAFGSTTQPTQSTSNLFGPTNTTNTMSNAGGQGTLTASIAQPIATNVPIFSLLPTAPQNMESDARRVNFFVDVPTRVPANRSNLAASLSGSKLRGFGSSPSLSDSSVKFSFAKGTPHGLSVTKPPDFKPTDSLLGRSGSPSLGSGNKKSVKKLIFDKKVEPTELFVRSGSPSPLRGKVTFTPALSIAQREKEAEERSKTTLNLPPTPTPAPRQHSTPNRFTAEDETASPQEGDYWVKPDMNTLRGCGYDQISSFQGLVVGRIGYGEIHFLEPVDLTGLPKLGSLLGEVIRFDDKECSVYPDSDDVDKPPPGFGLNVRARIILKHCWAVDKANREPVKDEKHPSAIKHLKRLRGMKETHFESFDIKDGTWTFTVDHF